MIAPLAERVRPQKLEDIIGQKHIFGKDNMLQKMISAKFIPNMIFYGPPGTGKTTTAQIISNQTNKRFFKLNATTASLSDIKNILSEINPVTAPNGVLLYLDEIQYFNKKQQQSLLEFIEKGKITLIASTTENPYFYIYNALLSRLNVFEFKPLSKDNIEKAISNAVKFLENENNIKITINENIKKRIAALAVGDVRKALNILEICYISSEIKNKKIKIEDEKLIEKFEENSFAGYNKTGDDHFDLLSAFQKSLRGSDPHASIYYLARLLEVGELISACRRLLVCTCEDVGLAYPGIFSAVKSLTDIAMSVGMPEARIPLANAVIMVAMSPKSNSAYKAINNAMQDIKKGNVYPVPRHLQNIHCDSISSVQPNSYYYYPHDYKNHWKEQQYLPDEIKNKKYYYPQENKTETAFKNNWERTTNKKF